MAKKKAVKVRKWITCAEPGCKRRSLVKGAYCKEHLEKFNKKIAAAARRRMDKRRKVRKVFVCIAEGCELPAHFASPFCPLHKKEHEKSVTSADANLKKKQKKATANKEAERVAELVRKRSKKEKADAAARRSASPASRLLKAYCEKCSYTIRLSRKWIEVKRPLCPVCLKNMVTELDGLIDADPRQLPLRSVKKGRADPDAAKKIGEALEGGV